MKKIKSFLFFFSKYSSGFILLFFYIITTNLPILMLTWYFTASRPIIVIDYILILPLLFFSNKLIFRFLFLITLILVYITDCLIWVRQFFPFMRFEDILPLAQMLFNAPNIYKFLMFIALLMFLIQIFIIFAITNRLNSQNKVGALVAILLLTIFSYILPSNKNIGMYETKGWINSQVLYVYRLKDNLLFNILTWQAELLSNSLIPASYLWWPDKKLKHDISNKALLILHESWGYSNNAALNKEILQKFILKQEDFVYFESGHIPAVGATIDGELRELCQLKSTNFNLKSIKQGFEECLPNQFKRKGYETYAFHSASSTIYDRNYWYKKVGFDNSIFFENVKNPILCYSFYGNCDSNIFSNVSEIFRNTNQSFVYWLTLNSHYPYDLKDLKIKSRIDCMKHNILLDSEECRNLQLTTQFIDQLADMTSDISMKGVEVILVGDHEPPILKNNHNYKVFKENSVSWIHFKIKN